MIRFNINNGQKVLVDQFDYDGVVTVNTFTNTNNLDQKEHISAGDFIMLLNYYRYIKDNDIQCDFINPNGKNSK